MTMTESGVHYDMYDRELFADPYPTMARLRESAPVFHNEEYGFYDITSWALPLSYGVKAYALGSVPGGAVKLADPDPNGPDESADTLTDSMAVGVPFTARVSRVGPLVMRDTKGAIVGKHKVTITAYEGGGDVPSSAPSSVFRKSIVPPEYNEQSKLSFEVPSGGSISANFELKSNPSAK